MAFERDQGTCCLVLPLKFGVGLISMLVFAQSLLCIVALFTGDIRFQENGYNLHTFRLPSVVGAAGLLFGFVGLLGVYDDKLLWVKAFNRFLLAKIAIMVVASVADLWTLGKCDSWLNSEEHVHAKAYGHLGIAYTESNAALDTIAELHVCPWARWAYLIGFSIDLLLWVYCAVKSILFEMELHNSMGYLIDFGRDKCDAETRWKLYHVKDPRLDALRPLRPGKIIEEKEEPEKLGGGGARYGAMEAAQPPYYHVEGYGPDGMHPINRGMSAQGAGFATIVGSPAATYSPTTVYSPTVYSPAS